MAVYVGSNVWTYGPDDPPYASVDVTIRNNVDAKILNNKFTGSGSVGVWIDGDETTDTWAEKNSLIGNNYFGATYTDASVYLGPYSRKCKVVGVAIELDHRDPGCCISLSNPKSKIHISCPETYTSCLKMCSFFRIHLWKIDINNCN